MAKKVILVDDSRTILASAELALEELVQSGQVHFFTYSNPQQFLDEALGGSIDYDLLISDINMPQVSGLEVSAKLKQDPRFKSKPILILTTESSAEMKEKGKAIGVTGWMVKPFSDQKLVKSIKMVLGI
ncbi:response regulator receiver [Desulfurispirillum indicum S5]|uniref:Response regulator receiver n=1 Tax=Desulfurispirillum indicum (strain ATCC BAA-1389 / DSM 22839 / S5) TaxID=653733 RepID=E6W501_DESIS|nr:response regulator [Desulfurispirillum indicum]ADU65977.1 response regulator receiver [Desulfurispirillum indicum S5]